MKKAIVIILSVMMIAALASCGAVTDVPVRESGTEPKAGASGTGEGNVSSTGHVTGTEGKTSSGDQAAKETVGTDETQKTASPETGGVQNKSKTLVVVFSATGTTKGVAQKIAAIEGADLYEIKAANEYTSADLNWNDRNSRSTKEQNDKKARPQIGSDPVSLEGYSTIYIGFPIWWGEEPRIMDTFVESYDFGGITMIPFCTSSSSGIGRSGKNLEKNAKSGKWLDGRRFSGSVSEKDLESWINGLK